MERASVSHEEVLEIAPVIPAYMALTEVRIGKKVITFGCKATSTKVSFERGVAHGGHPDFNITVSEEVSVKEKCSMGHEHETGKYKRNWGMIQMSWEQAEALMAWVADGDWKKVRAAAKREKL